MWSGEEAQARNIYQHNEMVNTTYQKDSRILRIGATGTSLPSFKHKLGYTVSATEGQAPQGNDHRLTCAQYFRMSQYSYSMV